MRKSKGKRLLSLLLTLCMVISLVPATAFAADTAAYRWVGSTLYVKNGTITNGDLYNAIVEKYDAGTYKYAASKPTGGWTFGGTELTPGDTSTITVAEGNAAVGKKGSTNYKDWTGWGSNSTTYTFTVAYYYEVAIGATGTIPEGGAVTVTTTTLEGTSVTAADATVNGGVKYNVCKGDTVTVNVAPVANYAAQIKVGENGSFNNIEDKSYTYTAAESTALTVQYVSTEKPKHEVSISANDITLGEAKLSVTDVQQYEESEITVSAEPEAGCYVESVKITGATLTDASYDNTNYTAKFTVGTSDVAVEVTFAKKTIDFKATADMGYNPMLTYDLDELEKMVFNAVVTGGPEGSLPTALTAENMTIQYESKSSLTGNTAWRDLNWKASGLESAYSEFPTELGKSAKVKITWPGNDQYPEVSVESTITLVDSRPDAKVVATIAGGSVKLTGDETTDKDAVTAKITEVTANGTAVTPKSVDVTLPQLSAGKSGMATVVITVAEDANGAYKETTTKVEVPVYMPEETFAVTVNVENGELGKVEGVTNGQEIAKNGKFTLTVTPYNELTGDTDLDAYVKSVKINGEAVEGTYNGTVFTAKDAFTVTAATTVEVEFAKRDLVLKAAPYTVAYNKYYEPKDVVAEIEKAIKDALIADSTLGYSVDATSVKVYVDKLGYQTMGALANLYFNDATEVVQLTLGATDRYPAVSVEGITINVVDSRGEAVITPGTPAEVLLDGNDEADIKEAVLKVASAKDSFGKAIALTADHLTVAMPNPLPSKGQTANAVVTITITESAGNLETVATVNVPVKAVDEASKITVSKEGNGKVTVGAFGEGENTSFAADLTITATPDAKYYVADVLVNDESVMTDAKFNGTVFTDTLKVKNNSEYTVKVVFAERTVTVAENPVVTYNKAKTVYSQATDIEDKIKALVSGIGYDAATATVEVYNNTLNLYVNLKLADTFFAGPTEQVKVTIPAVGKYPAVEEIFKINVEDSRLVREIGGTASMEVASVEEIKAGIEAKAIEAAGLTGVEGVTCTYEVPETVVDGMEIAVALAVAGDETYQDSEGTVTVSIIKVETTAKVEIKTVGNGSVNEKTEGNYEATPGSHTLVVAPAEGSYVDYIVVTVNGEEKTIPRDQMVASTDKENHAYSYVLDTVVGQTYEVKAVFMTPDISVDATATMSFNGFVEKLTEKIKAAVNYKQPENLPAGKLVVEYWAAPTTATVDVTEDIQNLGWVEIGKPLTNLQQLAQYHEFGAQATEVVRFKYVFDVDNYTITKQSTLTLTDERVATEIKWNEGVAVTYGQFTADELKAALLDGVYASGSKIEGAEVTFEKDPTTLNAGDEVKVTLKYAGSAEYKTSTATATITINKASAAVTVNSQTVKYGTSYGELVTTAPADVDTIDLIVGVDAANLQLDKENGVKGAEAVVMMQLPELKVPDEYKDTINEKLEEILGITGAGDKLNDILNSEKEVSMKEAIALLQSMNIGDGAITDDVINQVVQNLENIQAELGVEDVKVILNGEPEDIGVYLVAGITADQNYETAMNVGYLAITPDGQRAYLDWKIHDENGFIALPAIQNGNYDLSAYVTSVAEGTVEGATAELEHVFFGVDTEGNIILTQDQNDLTLGGYTELAFILNWGNTMYYAEPIARAFVVVPKLVDVKFVDDSGAENADRVFTYDGTAHQMPVAVEGTITDPANDPNLTVRYVGTDTTPDTSVEEVVYNSTTPPTNAGVYMVTATYIERDANGTVVGMGIDVGAMVIKLNEDATIEVTDFVQKTYDGNAYDVNNMITSGPADAKRLIITSSVDSSGDVSVNGLAGLNGNVNMDFPTAADNVLKEIDFFAPAYTSTGLKASDFAAWLEANGTVLTDAKFMTETVAKLVETLNQLPDNATLTFHETADVAPTVTGAYVVVGMIFDPNYMPVMDMGMLVIVPDAEQVTLKYEEDFNGNNIFTTEGLKHIDLDAAAYNADDTLNADATALVQNVYIGIDAQGNEVVTTDWTTLGAGVYTEYSYLLDMGNEMYYAAPISRAFVIAPDLIKVEFIDENGYANYLREFTYDGEVHAMNAVATYNGNVVTDGTMTVKYIGIEGDGEGYNSTTPPTEAGVYTVTATYVDHKADGSVAAAGFAVGEMMIRKAESTFDIMDTTETYDGESKFVEVVNNENAKYVALVADRANKTVNIAFPEELDELAAYLPASVEVTDVKDGVNAAIEKALEELNGAVELPESFTEKLDEVLAEVDALMAEVPNVTVTFNEENPVDAGTYEVYVVTYAANHNSVYDKAELEITKRPVTIKADDKEVIVGNAEPEYTYSVTEGSIVEGDELVVTVDCPSYEDVVGTYAIVATCEAHANYEVTTENGTLTVTEKPAVPVTGVTLSSTTATLEIDETTTLTATVEPADASVQGVTWKSSDESVATVDANGLVTAVGAGTATITVTTVDGEFTATCTVTVNGGEVPPVEEDNIKVTAYGKGENIPAYTVKGHDVTVTYDLPCKVGYLNAEGTYTAIATTGMNSDGSYNYIAPEGVNEVIVVVRGDGTGDGKLNNGDFTRLNAVLLGKTTFNEIAFFAADGTGDGKLNNGDFTRLNAVLLSKTTFKW